MKEQKLENKKQEKIANQNVKTKKYIYKNRIERLNE